MAHGHTMVITIDGDVKLPQQEYLIGKMWRQCESLETTELRGCQTPCQPQRAHSLPLLGEEGNGPLQPLAKRRGVVCDGPL